MRKGKCLTKEPWYEQIWEEDLRNIAEEENGNISSVEIDPKNKKIYLTMAYKTGDGSYGPYGDWPPDDEIIEAWTKKGFEIETDGSMHYPDGSWGNKWIYGEKTVPFTDKDTLEIIKQKVKKAVE